MNTVMLVVTYIVDRPAPISHLCACSCEVGCLLVIALIWLVSRNRHLLTVQCHPRPLRIPSIHLMDATFEDSRSDEENGCTLGQQGRRSRFTGICDRSISCKTSQFIRMICYGSRRDTKRSSAYYSGFGRQMEATTLPGVLKATALKRRCRRYQRLTAYLMDAARRGVEHG